MRNLQHSRQLGLRKNVVIALLLAGAAMPSAAFAADDVPGVGDAAATAADQDREIVVTGQKEKEERPSPITLSVKPTAGIAAVYTLNQDDISGLPISTVNDLLRAIPGVEAADLGNGGIPNGVTIRGWGLVSDGTAVKGIVDGYSRNFVWGPNSNGSDDLNVLIPEVLGSVNVIKGPFDTRYSGNFAYAGSAIFTTADSAPNRAAVSLASFGHVRGLLTLGNGQGDGPTKFYVALEGLSEEGRRDNNSQDKVNIFGKLTTQLSAKDVLKITAQYYNDVFGQPGYIRTDLVQRGIISEYSATDNSAKGWRRSQTATLEWQHRDAVFNFDINAWLEYINQYRSIERQDIAISSIFPSNAFHDKRWVTGLDFDPWVNFKVAGIDAIFRAGAGIRGDFIDLQRYPAFGNAAVPQPTVLDAWTGFFNYVNGHVWNPHLYGELSLKPASWIKLTGGIRDDWFNYNATVTNYPSTATGVTAATVQGPPTLAPNPLLTTRLNGWSDKPTLHGGIAITPGAGFTILGNFGEGITSQNISQFTVKGGIQYPTLYLNPSLAPTKLNTKEVVLKYDNEKLGLNLQGGVYSTLNQGEIGSDPATGNPVNLGKSIRKGFDIDARLRLYDRNGTTVRIGGNYNWLYAKLTGGTNNGQTYITGTPPWTAGWNIDAATPVGPDDQKLRFTVRQTLVGGTYLTNGPATIVTSASPAGVTYGTGVLRNGDYNRVAFKLQYERPRFHNFKVYFSGISFGGDRYGEMATTSVGFFTNSYTVKGVTYRVANSQPKFRAEGGVSIDF